MTIQNLKCVLYAAIALCLVLAAALGYLTYRHDHRGLAQDEGEPVVARGPATARSGAEAGSGAPTEDTSLAPMQISAQHMQEIGITTAVVEMKAVSSELEAPGSVAMDERRVSAVQTRFPGWIREVFASATYQYVKKGQHLFTIYSPDLVSTEQEVLLAKQSQSATAEHMHGTAVKEGDWLLQAAEERLRRFDVPEAEIAKIEQGGVVEREVAVDSPASGYIIERNALPNAYVQPETKLYEIADLSTVWVYANVSQIEVGRLKAGDRAEVTVDAYPERTFSGRVDQIVPDVDVTTRTVKVRVVLSNPGVALKPGMFVNVKIIAPLGRQLMIPTTGVLQAGDRQIAFIDHGEGRLEPRLIETGLRVGDSIVVVKGLNAGERIVNSANFLVDSEAQLQEAMRGYAGPPASASGELKEGSQAQVNLVAEPSRKGENKLRVSVTDARGKPLPGAQIGVAFIMPPMPAMGMSAMHAAATLADLGQGRYEGPIRLNAGGTWQVTVTVSKGGQTLAIKKLSVNIAGGM